MLHVHVDALMDAVVLQGADHFQAGAVADVREARIFVAAEIALQDAAVRGAVEDRAPGFEFAHAVGRFLGVQFGHAPVVDVLAAAHGVGEMDLPVVAVVDVGQRRRDAALGHDGVRFAEQRFADHADRHARRRCFDGRAQPGAAGADDQHVVFDGFRVVGHRQAWKWIPRTRRSESPVAPDAHRAEPHVEVGEHRPNTDSSMPRACGGG